MQRVDDMCLLCVVRQKCTTANVVIYADTSFFYSHFFLLIEFRFIA